jgi:hypothetical protein
MSNIEEALLSASLDENEMVENNVATEGHMSSILFAAP